MAEHEAGKEGGGLARSMSPGLLILYALGTTLGAGIFVVIGEIIGVSGVWAPVSFALASLVAGLTGASFAELAGRIPSSGGPVAWATEAFGKGWLPIAIGWAIIAAGVVSAATIATGFVAYAGVFVDFSKGWMLSVLVGGITLIAASGIKQSAWFMATMSTAGLIGLAIVLALTAQNIPDWPRLVAEEGASFTSGGVASGILLGGFLAFYAFIGFEDIVHLGEEVKDVEKSIPLAISITLAVSLILYVLVATAAVTTLPVGRLAEAEAPLIEMLGEAPAAVAAAVAVLSLVTIGDGLLAQLIMASRTIFDLGERRNGAPAAISQVSERTHTPVVATLLGGATILALALFFPTGTLASGTSAIVLAVFAAANIALILLKRRKATPTGVFDAPVWVPYAGLTTCLGLLAAQLTTGGSV